MQEKEGLEVAQVILPKGILEYFDFNGIKHTVDMPTKLTTPCRSKLTTLCRYCLTTPLLLS